MFFQLIFNLYGSHQAGCCLDYHSTKMQFAMELFSDTGLRMQPCTESTKCNLIYKCYNLDIQSTEMTMSSFRAKTRMGHFQHLKTNLQISDMIQSRQTGPHSDSRYGKTYLEQHCVRGYPKKKIFPRIHQFP